MSRCRGAYLFNAARRLNCANRKLFPLDFWQFQNDDWHRKLLLGGGRPNYDLTRSLLFYPLPTSFGIVSRGFLATNFTKQKGIILS